MAYIKGNNLWWNKLYKIVSAKTILQERNLDRLKDKVNETSRKEEKITTNFEPTIDDYVVNKAYLDTN